MAAPQARREHISRLDLYEDGLFGGDRSAEKRRALFSRLGLPARLSASAALPLLNQMLTPEEYKELVNKGLAD
jgi:ribonuclease M5